MTGAAAHGEPRRSLKQQRRLADAWVAADEHGGARHEPAAEHAVEFGHAGREPWRIAGLGLAGPRNLQRGPCRL